MEVGGRIRLPATAKIALAAAIMCIVSGSIPLVKGFTSSSAFCRIRGAGLGINPRRAMSLHRLRMGGGNANFVGGGKTSSLPTATGGRSPSASRGSKEKIGLDPKQLKGYVIVPETSASPVQKNNGWTLWDQRSRGVTVMIGNSKARRQRAKDGEHFGPLSAPSIAKIDHQLKDLREQKKVADKELEDAEDAHANGIEIATIKKKKLAIKDRIAILEAKIEKYKPSDYQPKMLGEGAYGAILLGRDIASGEGVAIKVEPIGNSIDARLQNSSGISYEYSVFSKLKGVKGFPIVKYFGRQQVMNRDCKVMVMELLGESVEDLWWDVTGGGRGFDVPTSLAVADEMLELLEKLHERGYVHRDIKPDNFLVHNPDGTGHLVLIDLGISKKWQDDEGAHLPMSKGNDFFGTCRYASINAHQGMEQSRRDDLESLAYTLAFLLTGKLPWEAPDGDVGKVGIMKLRSVEKISTGSCLLESEEGEEDLCAIFSGLEAHTSEMLQDFLLYTRSLEYEQEPDYAYLKGLVQKAYEVETGKDKIERGRAEWVEWKRQEAENQASLSTGDQARGRGS